MLLIKNCNIMDPFLNIEFSNYDILINNDGIITNVNNNIPNLNYKLLYLPKNIIVVPTFIDVHVHFRSPGYEHKETMESGINSAIKGGYLAVVGMANTLPVCDNINTLKYIIECSKKINKFFLYMQICSITKELNGKELTNFYDLIKHGAVGFSDDGNAINNINICYKAMLQAKKYDIPLSLHEESDTFVFNNGINFNSNLPLGAMNISEYGLIDRDIKLATLTKAKINFQHISTHQSVDLIRNIKSKYNNIFCEVTPHHISLTENDVKMNTNFKCNPPLRNEKDRKALINGIIDKTIDIIATDHAPHSLIEKQKNFFDAPSGIIGLETAFSVCNTYLVKTNYISKFDLLKLMSLNPAKLYNIEKQFGIKKGNIARITLLNFDEEIIYNKFHSKSCNSPYYNKKLYGKVYGTILGNKFFKN